MDKNFTPLDVAKLDKKFSSSVQSGTEKSGFESIFNTVFILLATLTVLAISIVLYMLIQKESRPQSGLIHAVYAMEQGYFI